MTVLPVNEVFKTIQGEAHFTGTPALFIRLQGCDVGCPWCDTKHTWETDKRWERDLSSILQKDEDAPTFVNMTPAELAALASTLKVRHIVITGGEPCIHDLSELTAGLHMAGHTTQVETSGTSEISVSPRTWVTLSPKIGMPGGKEVLEQSWRRANEIKIPVGKPIDIERVVPHLDYKRPEADVWLQPLSQSRKATELCIASATANHWRISVQTHKFIGIR